MTTWRVGTHVPLNVYDGDRPVCQCHNAEDAARIVAAMNGVQQAGLRPTIAEMSGSVGFGGRVVFDEDGEQRIVPMPES